MIPILIHMTRLRRYAPVAIRLTKIAIVVIPQVMTIIKAHRTKRTLLRLQNSTKKEIDDKT